MRVGVIQSAYIPWRGYFDFIANVDLFVFHDDLQYTKGDWRNRNRIKTPQGPAWITVPVRYQTVSQLILETEIDYSSRWGGKHIRQWLAHYKNAPYLNDVVGLISEIETCRYLTISELNQNLIARICQYLKISTPTLQSVELSLTGSKTDRLIDLLVKLGATTYLSGPSADAYLDKDAFRKNGINLEYKSYSYQPYPQLWGAFEGNLSVLDLIANCGPESVKYLCSQQPNSLVVEA